MAENINIDFMPNRKTSDIQRVTTVEDYLKLFTDRTKFCFASVYDDFADMGKRIENLESFSLATPSSLDLTVENAVILQEKESQQVIHNYTKVHYVDGNSVGYGDIANNVICNGYSLRSQSVNIADAPKYKKITFPKVYDLSSLAFGQAVIKSATEVVIEAVVAEAYPSGNKQIKVNVIYTDDSDGVRYVYNYSSFQVTANQDYCVSPYWTSILAPTKERPYGTLRVTLQACSGSEGNWEAEYSGVGTSMYIPFQSEAEYNAAVGLTNTPIELIKIQDFQRLVPESQIIVDKALSPDSDNVIANSAVAKALAEKADKVDVQSIALAVKEKAESSDLTAHTDDKSNPHKVTKEQIGLSNVENKSSADILSELSIGGTQILRNTQTTVLADITAPALWSEGAWRKASGANGTWESIDVTDSPEPFIEKGWRIASVGESTSTIQLITITQNNIPLAIGKEYILSCYARGKGTFMISAGGSPAKAEYTAIDNTEWKKLTLTFTTQGAAEYSVYFGVRYQGDSVEVCGMKLEVGNRATSWNICPKDIADHEDRIKALEAAILSLGGET